MANTINDLYLKYVKNVGKLENDKYFRYLYEMVQAGENTLKQQHQIMHKVVDEKWLSTIEDSLDAINRIVEKPRRFVARNEEVVPVELAKKITADSVRHLSMHTQFIASAKNDDIQPTHILNVTNEESFDLYENRFIYHLILRLVTFIDKRTDIIFWSTGDETRNTFHMESKIDDAYEQIEYKVEMTVKNRQNFMEADADNMNVFMRIDRVRRLVMALRRSSFCEIMQGCAKVRSPIQRTNLLMKDPDYRTCYKLWQFLESYEDVGYSIDIQDRTLEFDEEYLIQMYTNLITNYTVFKTITEEDERNLKDIPPKRKRVLKPKFIRKIEEEIVDEDCDLLDVEVKQVIIEEVTEAQLEAEARLAEEIAAREHAESALEEAEDTILEYTLKAKNAIDAMAQAKALQFAAEKMQKLAEADLKKSEAEKREALDMVKAGEKKLAETISAHETEMDELKQMASAKFDELKAAAAAKLEEQIAESDSKLAELRNMAMEKLAAQKAESDAAYEEQKQYYTDFIASQKSEMEQHLSDMVKSHAEELEAQKAATDSVLAAQKVAADAAIEAQKAETEAALKAQIAESELAMKAIKEKAEASYTALKKDSIKKLDEQKTKADKRLEEQKNATEAAKAEAAKLVEEERAASEVAIAEEKASAAAKTKELADTIEKLTKEKEELLRIKQELEVAKAQLEVELSRSKEAHQKAEQRAEHEAKLRELVEERAGSESIGDFISRTRAERRERRKSDK